MPDIADADTVVLSGDCRQAPALRSTPPKKTLPFYIDNIHLHYKDVIPSLLALDCLGVAAAVAHITRPAMGPAVLAKRQLRVPPFLRCICLLMKAGKGKSGEQ